MVYLRTVAVILLLIIAFINLFGSTYSFYKINRNIDNNFEQMATKADKLRPEEYNNAFFYCVAANQALRVYMTRIIISVIALVILAFIY